MMTSPSRRIAIAADSVCDLPADLAARLGVHVIPTYINVGERSLADDGVTFDRAQFYRDLPSMPRQPTTAAPSPGDAEAFYRGIFASGAEHVISLHVPARLSGTMNAMRLGADFAANRVTLVDSLQLTFGIGFQAWVAAEMAHEGASVPDILAAIERVRQNTRVYAVIDTLEYLRRSGRVNALVASLGSLLRIKPIISVQDGDITSLSRQRAWKRAERRLRELTYAESPLERLAILHTANRAGAERFLESIDDIAPSDKLVIECTPTIGAHVGPGSLGVATLRSDWRQ